MRLARRSESGFHQELVNTIRAEQIGLLLNLIKCERGSVRDIHSHRLRNDECRNQPEEDEEKPGSDTECDGRTHIAREGRCQKLQTGLPPQQEPCGEQEHREISKRRPFSHLSLNEKCTDKDADGRWYHRGHPHTHELRASVIRPRHGLREVHRHLTGQSAPTDGIKAE